MEVIELLGISILAEEFNDEAKRIWKVSESILEQLAKAKGVEHRFCDPLPFKKEKLGLENRIQIRGDNFGSHAFGTAKAGTCCSFVVVITSRLLVKNYLQQGSMLSMARDGKSVMRKFGLLGTFENSNQLSPVDCPGAVLKIAEA